VKVQREMLVDNLWKMLAEIDVCHPIYHHAYDLCDMYKQKSLSVFKITMLKEICAHFELQFKSKDKKHTHRQNIIYDWAMHMFPNK
jgi:hypothetical protein